MRPAWPFVFASWYWVIARAGFSQDVGNTAQQRPCLTCQCLCMGIPNMTELCELHYANMSTSNLSNVFKICYAGTSPIALFTAFICLWGPCRRGIFFSKVGPRLLCRRQTQGCGRCGLARSNCWQRRGGARPSGSLLR